MNNQTISEVETHKHLGIFISNDCTWHTHIKHITEKAWKRVNIMKKLKFLLDRKALETIYLSFIRPLLEYGNVVWSNAAQYELDELDKIQTECARISSGCTRLVSIESLNAEMNWESLSYRRYIQRMVLFYKIQNDLAPEYLSSRIPQQINNRYNLRNSSDIPGIYARTSSYFNSFCPTAIREWNILSQTIKGQSTVSSFKYQFKKNNRKTPIFYYHGDRKYQVLHTRLRTKCSALNHHLFLKNITDTPLCACGQIENNQHYFFTCVNYDRQRHILMQSLQLLQAPFELETLLFGNNNLSDQTNSQLFSHVHTYIKNTKRFN